MFILLAQQVDIKGNLGPTISLDPGFLLGRFAGVGLLIGALFAFGYLVFGGVSWVMSGGDKGKVESARNMITQALIGIAITVAAFALFGVINYFFGLGINISGIN